MSRKRGERTGWRTFRQRAASSAAAAAAAVGAALLSATSSGLAEPIDVEARLIERFDGARPTGRLDFLGGLVLRGPAGFGGFSGLLLERDRLLAASDTGRWLTARMEFAGGRLVGLAQAELLQRRDSLGQPITNKRSGDAEALAFTEAGVLVLVEMGARLLAYPAEGLSVDRSATPALVPIDDSVVDVLSGGKVEALARLPDGRTLIIAEASGPQTASPAATLGGERYAIARDGAWAVTGAHALPGGDVVVVERRFGGLFDVGLRLRRLPRDAFANRQDGLIDGPVLLEADFSAEIDNMEAVAADVEGGRIVLTLMSDDNHAVLQRTLILRFAVRDPLPPRKPAGPGG